MIKKTDKKRKEEFISKLLKKGKTKAYAEKQYQRMKNGKHSTHRKRLNR